MNRPLAREFVDSEHVGQWWSDLMTNDDMINYIEQYVLNNWADYLAYVADRHTYGL